VAFKCVVLNENAGPARMGRTLEEVDRDIRDAVDAKDVQRLKLLVAEKTELLAGIGLMKSSAIMSVILKRNLFRLSVLTGKLVVYR
jgi:hypothetical protein